jgi:hypothetical protein
LRCFFQKQASKTKKIASSSTPLFIDDVKIKGGGLDSAPLVQSDIEGEIEIGDTTPHPPSPQQPN